eukprot:6020761-Amphidinium_carterae.1
MQDVRERHPVKLSRDMLESERCTHAYKQLGAFDSHITLRFLERHDLTELSFEVTLFRSFLVIIATVKTLIVAHRTMDPPLSLNLEIADKTKQCSKSSGGAHEKPILFNRGRRSCNLRKAWVEACRPLGE